MDELGSHTLRTIGGGCCGKHILALRAPERGVMPQWLVDKALDWPLSEAPPPDVAWAKNVLFQLTMNEPRLDEILPVRDPESLKGKWDEQDPTLAQAPQQAQEE